MAGMARRRVTVKRKNGRTQAQMRAEKASKRTGTGGVGQAASAIRKRQKQLRELMGQ